MIEFYVLHSVLEVKDMVNVAILGFGTVGSGVAEVLSTNEGLIDQRVRDLVRLKYILDVRDFPV